MVLALPSPLLRKGTWARPARTCRRTSPTQPRAAAGCYGPAICRGFYDAHANPSPALTLLRACQRLIEVPRPKLLPGMRPLPAVRTLARIAATRGDLYPPGAARNGCAPAAAPRASRLGSAGPGHDVNRPVCHGDTLHSKTGQVREHDAEALKILRPA
jgi:hypothetical protein